MYNEKRGLSSRKELKKMPGGWMVVPNRDIDLGALRDFLGRYAFAAGFVKDKVVLDVACGSGYGSAYLSDKGARIVVGGDISAEQIEAARSFYGGQGIEFLVLDATRLPFADGSFDAIVSMETIEHLEQYQDYLGECKRVLKEGGLFICSTPNKGHGIPEITKFGDDHIHEFYLEEFQNLLSQFFVETQLYGQGCWDKVEKTKWRIWIRIEKAMKPFILNIPKLYQIVRFFARKFIFHHTQFRQITDFDRILDEKHEPFPLVGSRLVPITIIAVARKPST